VQATDEQMTEKGAWYHGVEDVVAEDLDDGEGDPEREEPAHPVPSLQRRLPPLRRHVGEPADVGEAAGDAQAAAQQQRAHPRAQHPQHHPRQRHRLPDAPRHHQLRNLVLDWNTEQSKKNDTLYPAEFKLFPFSNPVEFHSKTL